MALTRRGLIGAIIAAPAIVRASSLMPIKSYQSWWGLDLAEESDVLVTVYLDTIRIIATEFQIPERYLMGNYQTDAILPEYHDWRKKNT